MRGLEVTIRVAVAASIGVGALVGTAKAVEYFKQFDMVEPNAEVPALVIGSILGLVGGKSLAFTGFKYEES